MTRSIEKKIGERISLDGDDLETVNKFSYQGHFLSTEKIDLISRIKSTWKKFRDVSCMLCKKCMHG